EASRLIEHASGDAVARGEGLGMAFAEYVSAVLHNGLGRYAEAVSAVRESYARTYELGATTWAVAELVEAAARSGERELAETARARLAETTGASGTPWARGIEARSRALLAGDAKAEQLFVEAIEQLSTTALRPDLARAHLVYGEWLRRAGRRVDAREQLRAA